MSLCTSLVWSGVELGFRGEVWSASLSKSVLAPTFFADGTFRRALRGPAVFAWGVAFAFALAMARLDNECLLRRTSTEAPLGKNLGLRLLCHKPEVGRKQSGRASQLELTHAMPPWCAPRGHIDGGSPTSPSTNTQLRPKEQTHNLRNPPTMRPNPEWNTE